MRRVCPGWTTTVVSGPNADQLTVNWSLSGDYQLTRAFEVPMLDRIMGLARDDEGFLYVASGIVESLHEPITTEYPAPGEYRSGIVRVVKLDSKGEMLLDVDLDLARQATGTEPELLINPMVAAAGR